MDIGPINAIRSVPAVARRRQPDLGGVFEIEFRNQQQEADSMTRRASRGLEDEDGEEEFIEGEAGAQAPSTINFFA